MVSHVAAMGMPAELRMLNRRFSAETLIGHMRRDKKVRDGALQFVLARGIGQTFTARRRAGGGGDRAAARRGVRGVIPAFQSDDCLRPFADIRPILPKQAPARFVHQRVVVRGIACRVVRQKIGSGLWSRELLAVDRASVCVDTLRAAGIEAAVIGMVECRDPAIRLDIGRGYVRLASVLPTDPCSLPSSGGMPRAFLR